MQRVVLATVSAFCILTAMHAIEPQASTDSVATLKQRSAPNLSPEDLLRQSYSRGRYLPPEERCFQLFRLAEASAEIRTPKGNALTKLWSQELFRRAVDLPPSWNQAAFEKNSLETLSAVDPRGAFELIQKIPAPEAGPAEGIPEDLRAFAAQKLFLRLLDAEGNSAFETVRAEANEIGRTGEYPYTAMGMVAKKLAGQKENDVLLVTFREALDFYEKGPHVRAANRDFVAYLESNWSYLPLATQREALTIVAGHLSRPVRPDGTTTEVFRVTTDKGVTSFQNENVALLYRILPKIRELDPRWASQLEEQEPSLKQTALSGTPQYSSATRVVNAAGGSPSEVDAAVDRGLQIDMLGTMKEKAQDDPDQAAKLLPSLSEPGLQSEALSVLAAAYARKDPARAAQFLAAAEKATDKLPANSEKLRAIASCADAAAALADAQSIDAAISKGFDLGQELLTQELDVNPGESVYLTDALEELSRLTRLGAQTLLPETLTRIDRLTSETLQAYLLIAAAEGLYIHANSTNP